MSNDLLRMRLCSTDCYYNIMSVSFSLGYIMLIMSLFMPIIGYFIGYTQDYSFIIGISPEMMGIIFSLLFSIISLMFLVIIISDIKTKRAIKQIKAYNKKNRTVPKKMFLALPKHTQRYLK